MDNDKSIDLASLDLDHQMMFDHAPFGVRICNMEMKLIYRNEIFIHWLPEIVPGDSLFVVEISRMDEESAEFDENHQNRLLQSLFKEGKSVNPTLPS